MSGRLSEVEHWKLHLEQTIASLDDESAALSRAKTAAEDEMEARHFDLETTQQALALREARLRQEVVRDDVEETLKQVMRGGGHSRCEGWTESAGVYSPE